MDEQAALANAATQLIDVPFRLHGRDPQRGLDCVGVIVASFAAIGRSARLPLRYNLRRTHILDFLAAAGEFGLVDVKEAPAAGDVLVARPGPAQFHAGIVSSNGGLVHAHAGLGRVVLSPAPLPWPLEHHWRLLDR